jgi:hypothetical protein
MNIFSPVEVLSLCGEISDIAVEQVSAVPRGRVWSQFNDAVEQMAWWQVGRLVKAAMEDLTRKRKDMERVLGSVYEQVREQHEKEDSRI